MNISRRAENLQDVVGQQGGNGRAVLVDGLQDLDQDLQRLEAGGTLLGLVGDDRRQVLVGSRRGPASFGNVSGSGASRGRETLPTSALDRQQQRDERVLQLLLVLELVANTLPEKVRFMTRY